MKNFTMKDVDLFNNHIKNKPLMQLALLFITKQSGTKFQCNSLNQLKNVYDAVEEVANRSGFEDVLIKGNVLDSVFSQYEKEICNFFDKVTKKDESIIHTMFDRFTLGQVCIRTRAVERYMADAVFYDLIAELYKWCYHTLGK